MRRRGGILVLEPGLLTTVQDLGRPGQLRHGVSPGGALDRTALILGNRLCGNEPTAAGLEITLIGPHLRFIAPTVVALTGADLGATLDGGSLPRWQPVAVPAGGEIAFPPARGGRGARAYLCVAGGIAVPPVLGSRATDLAARFGGHEGRALRADDKLPIGQASGPTQALLGRRLAIPPPEYPPELIVRVVMGPQRDRFTKKGVAAFLGGAYTVSPKGDRMGVRLTDGPPVVHRRGADLISEGIVPGSIQVPGDAQPIALLLACQTMGGYPKIATVIDADLDRLAQARPGDRVRFAAVAPAEARAATLAYRAALGEGSVTAGPRAVSHTSPSTRAATQPAGNTPSTDDRTPDLGSLVADAWTPDGVIRVIDALRAAGMTSFHLDTAAGDRKLSLVLGRDALSRPGTPAEPASVAEKPATTALDDGMILAPMLGIFYRQATPGEQPYVAPGDQVTTGQVIGLLEVMKTYHEVSAPRDGTLGEFLVADGGFVEYGQTIARLS